MTRSGGKLLSRSLDASTGRDPGTPVAPPGSEAAYVSAVDYVGVIKASKGAAFTAADAAESAIAMISPGTATKPCQFFTWATAGASFATMVTSTYPVKDAITCKATEDLAFTRDLGTPSKSTGDLGAVSDTSTRIIRHWYLPAS
jgi:hypothetical protein